MATPEFQDYYRTLGVPRTATQADIKKAFRKLARESHPDKHPGDTAAERRFKAINEANAVLSDAGKRAKYDQFGADWEAYSRAGAGAASGARDPFGPGSPFAGFNAAGFGGTRAGGGPGGTSGGVRFEFRSTGGGAGGFSDFFHMMFGDESAAAGESELFGGGSRRAGASGGNPPQTSDSCLAWAWRHHSGCGHGPSGPGAARVRGTRSCPRESTTGQAGRARQPPPRGDVPGAHHRGRIR
jgi:curved DNA-binding protein CbpA